MFIFLLEEVPRLYRISFFIYSFNHHSRAGKGKKTGKAPKTDKVSDVMKKIEEEAAAQQRGLWGSTADGEDEDETRMLGAATAGLHQLC